MEDAAREGPCYSERTKRQAITPRETKVHEAMFSGFSFVGLRVLCGGDSFLLPPMLHMRPQAYPGIELLASADEYGNLLFEGIWIGR
jgi:hypothetical protein